jgi:N-acetylmuramoyl-L-alanine amidase
MVSGPRAMFDRLHPRLTAPAIALVLSVSAAQAAEPNQLRHLRLGSHANQTHVVIEADGPFCTDIALSDRPFRLSIDLPELTGPRPAVPAKGLVAGAAWVGAGTATTANRVLFDLKQPVEVIDTFVVAPGDGKGFRRVIKLAPAGPKDFAAAQEKLGQLAGARGCSTAAKPTVAALTPTSPSAPLAAPPAPPPSIQPVAAPMPAPASRLPKDKRWTIVIDPGHGGDDPGAISVAGNYEKELTLTMAQVLKRKLEATKRFKVALTRSDDRFIELRERTAIADRDDVHLFMSLHADSILGRGVRGLSVYTLSDKASDAESEALAAKENRADLVVGVDHARQKGVDTRELLFRMEFDDVSQISRQFRKLVVDEMRGQDIETLPNPHRAAGFVVLKTRKVPSVLIEMGYLSNPADEKLLRQAKHQDRFANAVIKAADKFFACAEVRKWFEKNEEETVAGRGISCAPSLATKN